MNQFKVTGGRPLRGRITVPGDKSISHRALLLGALAEGTSVIRGLSTGTDVAATATAVAALGAEVDRRGTTGAAITGGRGRLHQPAGTVEVGNSGTTLRLMAGMGAAFAWDTTFDGDQSIRRRPMDRVAAPLRLMGAGIDGERAPLTVRGGGLHGIDYTLPVASAQVKGAVLLAGLGAEGETVVRESVATRAHTEEMLAACGAEVEVSDHRLVTRLRPGKLEPFELRVPGDPSQAAYWVVAACIVPGSEVVVERVYVGQARAAFVDVLRRMGADVELDMLDATTADIWARAGWLHGTTVGGDEVPGLIDEIPVLAVAAAMAEGPTTFADAGDLAVKETDRIAAVTAELSALGVVVEARPDGLVVAGGRGLRGAPVSSHGDHRMAMSLAVAALAGEGTADIDGWAAVATSYPDFVTDLERLCRAADR
ncbi:MAG: 3-phosphoshikimate 1-carboxyvinyltransferase [Acidimicrobiales bacterium]